MLLLNFKAKSIIFWATISVSQFKPQSQKLNYDADANLIKYLTAQPFF